MILNILRNANRVAGCDFTLSDWRHVALFDARQCRVEMHLEARRALRLCWAEGERDFAAGERIHTENSYKYERRAFEALLGEAGLEVQGCWTDERAWFAVLLARPMCRQ